jgi:hypothetical protein
MPLTSLQIAIRIILGSACERAGAGARIVYQTEWLGWLPFGQYHRVDVEHGGGKEDVSGLFPAAWSLDDLLALEHAGILRRESEAHEAASDMDRIVYEMTEGG